MKSSSINSSNGVLVRHDYVLGPLPALRIMEVSRLLYITFSLLFSFMVVLLQK